MPQEITKSVHPRLPSSIRSGVPLTTPTPTPPFHSGTLVAALEGGGISGTPLQFRGVESAATAAGVDVGGALATPGERLLAWVVDAVFIGVAFTPLNPALYSRKPSVALFFALLITALALAVVYLAAFDGGRRGATPGKRMIGIRVADANTGEPIGYRRAAVRRLGYFLGGLALYVGWLWLLIDPRRQTWHDKLARSIVVRAR